MTFDGDRIRLSHDFARKLYRCPGCRSYIDVGREHVFVEYLDAETFDHEHWHSECAARIAREFTSSRTVAAARPPKPKRRRRRG